MRACADEPTVYLLLLSGGTETDGAFSLNGSWSYIRKLFGEIFPVDPSLKARPYLV